MWDCGGEPPAAIGGVLELNEFIPRLLEETCALCQSNPETITVVRLVGIMPRKKAAAITDTRPARELRQRIADFRGLRIMTMDKQALEDIDRVIAETEALLQLRAL
jgi:vacuolar-type H+-ATPase subunit F/Vma7